MCVVSLEATTLLAVLMFAVLFVVISFLAKKYIAYLRNTTWESAPKLDTVSHNHR